MVDNEPVWLSLANEDLTALNTIAASVHQSLSLKEVYDIALDAILGITPFNIVMVYLVDENTNEAVLQAHRGLTENYIRRAERIPYPKGVTWKVIKSGEQILIKDVQEDPDLGPAGKALGHHTILILPIKQEEKTIGIIGFASRRVLELSSRDISLLNAIGSQIGTAIVQAYLYEKSQQQAEKLKTLNEDLNKRNKHLEILNTITQAVNQSHNLQEIYGFALDKLIELANVDIACIYLVDEIKHEAVVQEHRNFPAEFIQRAGRIPYPKGVTWKVINSGEILNVRNAEKDPNIGPAGRDLGFRSMLGIPIVLEGRTIGVIWLLSYREHLFTGSEEALLGSIVTQIAVVIAKAKQTKELEERNRNLSILSVISQAVHQSLDLEEVYKVALDMTIALENIDMAMVYLVDKDRKEATLQAHRNLPEHYIRRAERIPYPKGITWGVINSGEIINVQDAQKDPNIGPAGRDLGHHGILGIPITLEGKVIGVIWFLSYKEHHFKDQEIDLLTSIGTQIAIAISKAKLFEEMKAQQRALRRSEEQHRNLFENVPIGAYRTTPDGYILMANPALIQMLKYTSFDELASRNLEEVGFETSFPRSQFKELLERKGEVKGLEYNWVRHDGTIISVRENARAVRGQNGDILYYEGTVEDITEYKLAEEKLKSSHEQLRALAAALQSAREEERSRIAREIHDNLGQALTGLKMSLSWLHKKLSEKGDEVVRSEIASMSKLIDTTIQTVREISTDLRPGVLDDLGLTAAIEWQAQEFQTRIGIRCRFTTSLENITLDKHHSTAIFRILQEALTNVARHANANRVNISLRENADNLILEVRDNGKGITENEVSNPRSLGILGMKERALLLGGDVKIIGTLEKGTTVSVQIPVKGQRQ